MEQIELRKFAEQMIQMGKKILSTLDGAPKKKLERRSNPDIREFINWWCKEYEKRFNVPYHVVHGKDEKLVKRLLVTFKLEKLCEGAVKFLDSTDEFIAKKRDIGIFSMKINALLIEPTVKTTAQMIADKYARPRR